MGKEPAQNLYTSFRRQIVFNRILYTYCAGNFLCYLFYTTIYPTCTLNIHTIYEKYSILILSMKDSIKPNIYLPMRSDHCIIYVKVFSELPPSATGREVRLGGVKDKLAGAPRSKGWTGKAGSASVDPL